MDSSHFVENLNGDSKFFSLGAEYRGPGLLISTRKLGFAVSTRSRILVQGNDISEQSARLLWMDASDPELQGERLADQQAALNIQSSEMLDNYTTYLPASLGVNLDARLLGSLYMNVAWLGNLYSKRKVGLQQNSLLSLTPRLEGRVFELALPFSYYSDLKQFSFGPYFRLGPFFMGSDNLSGLLGMGDAYGADVYLAFSIYGVKKSHKNKKR